MQFLGVAGKQYICLHNGRQVVCYEISQFPVLDSVFTIAESQLGSADLSQLAITDEYIAIADSSNSPRPIRRIYWYDFDPVKGTYDPNIAPVTDVDNYATVAGFARSGQYRFRLVDFYNLVIEVERLGPIPVVRYIVYSFTTSWFVVLNGLSGERFSTIHTALSGDNLYIATKEQVGANRYVHRFFRHHIPTDTLYDATLTSPLDDNLVVRNVIVDAKGNYLYVDAGSIVRINLQTGAVLSINVTGGTPEQFIVDEAANALYLRYCDRVSVVTLSDNGYRETRTIRVDKKGQATIEQITFGEENRYLYFLDSNHRLWRLHMPTSDPNRAEDPDIDLEEL